MYQKWIKYILDCTLSLILIVIFSPVMFCITIALFIMNNGEILFKQQRPGKNEKLFFIYKYKTMNDECDDNGILLPDERRLTPVGKMIRSLSADELPQLFNVLKGDMSLVGPRPLLIEYLPIYNLNQRKRHDVKPGITGWAQINGRNGISWDEKFVYDLWYVNNVSFITDVKILIQTLAKVFQRDGISSKSHATMEKFQGNTNC